MPKGPRGERRPADTIGCAVHVARIATGEITEEIDDVSRQRQGGLARADRLSADERSKIARKAAKTRWKR